MKKLSVVLLYLLLVALSSAQKHVANVLTQSVVEIAPYYKGCQAALSLTFDDGLLDQYTLAFPQLKQRGLKATFAIIGSKVGGTIRSKQDHMEGTKGTPVMTWNMLREMAGYGYEIASHGWEHKAVTRLDAEALHREIGRNDSAIAKEIGQRPLTYFYPGNNKSPETIAICEQDKVGSRTFQLSLGSKRTVEYMRNWVDSLIVQHKWGVTMTHGISQGYDHFQDPTVLWQFLDYIQSLQSQLWVATFRDVSAYIRERENCYLTFKESTKELDINLSTSLSHALYTHPLTLVIHRPVSSVVQDGRPLPFIQSNDLFLVNVNPHGGHITVIKK